MTFPFNQTRGLIRVRVEVTGPTGSAFAVLALDTGASVTLISPVRLAQAGYDPAAVGMSVQTATAGGIVQAFRLPILSLTALGQTRNNLSVLARALPAKANVDGLLGLDFFRGQILTLDFTKGEITLAPAGAAP